MGDRYRTWPANGRDQADTHDAYGGYHDDRYADQTYGNQTYGNPTYGNPTYGNQTYGDAGYGDAADGNDDGDWYDDEDGDGGGAHRRRSPIGPGDAVRSAAGAVRWRYHSAPLWVRVTADMTAAVLALALIVGAALALHSAAASEDDATGGGASSLDELTTTDLGPAVTLPGDDTTTSTSSTTPTTEPPTTAPATTAAPPTTVARLPGSRPRPRPTTPPTTTGSTTTVPVRHYRNCLDALMAGALPIERGDPDYSRNLDRDGDGHACEPNEFP